MNIKKFLEEIDFSCKCGSKDYYIKHKKLNLKKNRYEVEIQCRECGHETYLATDDD